MPLEPCIVALVRHIVRKVQIDHGLLQIAGIIYIDDIGVFLAVLLCVSLGKLTLTNATNAIEEEELSLENIAEAWKELRI